MSVQRIYPSFYRFCHAVKSADIFYFCDFLKKNTIWQTTVFLFRDVYLILVLTYYVLICTISTTLAQRQTNIQYSPVGKVHNYTVMSNFKTHHYIICFVRPLHSKGGGPRAVFSTAAFHARVRGSFPSLGGLNETQMFLPHPLVKLSIAGSLRDLEVACSTSDRQGFNFESCVWRAVSSHHPQEVLLAQFSPYVHKSGTKPASFNFISFYKNGRPNLSTYQYLSF